MTIKTLENVSFEAISQANNAAFADYFFPIKTTPQQFEDKFACEGGRLDWSVGVFENGQLVAFIIHFFDIINGEKVIYNGGTGVTPAFRGQHLTAKMYDFILPILRKNGIQKLKLEVLTQNQKAIAIYQKQGFTITKELNCFAGQLSVFSNKIDQNYQITTLNDLDWDVLQPFWGYEPAWQNSISTMNNRRAQLQMIGVEKQGQIVAYLLYNPALKRIHQFAVAQKHRNCGLGNQLLNCIAALEKERVSFINIDIKMSGLKSFLEKRGLVNFTNQYEMELKI